ncbi:hypothetical protein ABKN59_004937 [Abortiporus biennis]
MEPVHHFNLQTCHPPPPPSTPTSIRPLSQAKQAGGEPHYLQATCSRKVFKLQGRVNNLVKPWYFASQKPHGTFKMSPVTLTQLPEELIERILRMVMISNQERFETSSALRHNISSYPTPPRVRTQRYATLLVSSTWLRIGTPLLYHTVSLRTQDDADRFIAALVNNSTLASLVRTISVKGMYEGMLEIFQYCTELESLDFVVSQIPTNSMSDVDDGTLEFCEGLDCISDLKQLVIRKSNQTYLTHPGPQLVLNHLAQNVSRWHSLETLRIPFRFSLPLSSPTTAKFLSALASAPSLKHIETVLPAVWNPTLLEISANPNLRTVHLAGNPPTEYTRSKSGPLLSSNLYLSSARSHPRLMELIRAGTPIFRSRSHTSACLQPSSRIDTLAVSSWSLERSSSMKEGNSRIPSPEIYLEEEEPMEAGPSAGYFERNPRRRSAI